MKRPSFQFYPADWRNNAKLRRCSEAARGAWMDVLCVLHDSDEYGVLRWPLADIARSAAVPLRLLRELADKDVLKGADKNAACYVYTPRHAGKDGLPMTLVEAGEGPCWYSSRLVRDEWVRHRRGKNTQFSEENQPPMPSPKSAPKPSPMPPFGDGSGDGSTSTSTSTSKTNTPIPPDGGSLEPARKTRKSASTILATFLAECEAKGERPLKGYAPLWSYVNEAGLDSDLVALAWAEFKRRFTEGGTKAARRQKDWRATFRNYVENNWLKLWYIDQDGKYGLTTQGKQAEKLFEARETA